MFSSNLEISSAQQHLELIKQAIVDSADASLQLDTLDDINVLLIILNDPIFRDILKIEDVLQELQGQLQQHPSILPADFDIVPTTGELVLNVPRKSDLFEPDVDEQRGELLLFQNRKDPVTHYSICSSISTNLTT